MFERSYIWQPDGHLPDLRVSNGHLHFDQVASCTGGLLRRGTELDSIVWKWQLDCRSIHDGKHFDLVCTIRLLFETGSSGKLLL
jgi:hypothetical protein